ncbi:MAG TPA: PilZ domain-containing protein, partial [Kofleriaceae bacterium]|nr:PilZ domain-containing protein [Kofleriaceae bacterium]
MSSRVFQPLVEVFLLVEQPRQRLSHWTAALAPLDSPDAPPMATIDAYYDPTSNQAIFGLRYDELALGPSRLGFLVDLALLVEVGMIQPAELSEAERGRFVTERLARCTVHVEDQRHVVRALVELVRCIRDHKPVASSPAVEVMPSTASRVLAAGALPPRTRSDTLEPMPVVVAKGTRDFGSVQPPLPLVPRELAHGSVRQPKSQFLDDVHAHAAAVPEPLPKQVITEPITPPARRRAALLPPRREIPRPSPHVVVRAGAHRAGMATRSPGQGQPMTQPMIEAAVAHPATDVLTAPYLPAAGDPLEPGTISARYLRSGRWLRIRICALSLKGATLMAGALPRVDDRIDVGLAYTNYRVLVCGVVEKISTSEESASSGKTTFGVRFELDEASRRELTALLTAARADKVTLKPAPMRSTRRYAVEWPICLGVGAAAVNAEALDVSTNGMFVAPPHALAIDAKLTFSAVLDDGISSVSGRSRVVRTLSDADARAAGLSPGYGLNIVEMPAEDRRRWSAFLT